MKNKRGFLLGEETLKIIIAVICIIFLVYLLGSLYYNSVSDKNSDLAKASLEKIVKEINAGATEIGIYNPENWVILNFKDNLLCICKNTKCEPDDTCVKSDIIVANPIRIEKPLPVILKLNGKSLSIWGENES